MPRGVYVRRQRPSRYDGQPLGEESDGTIAKRLGVTHEAVFYARKKRGIRSSRPQSARCNTSDFSDELGATTDREVAERHGIKPHQVAYARRSLGIRSTRIDWSSVPELGTSPDIFVARKYGVNNKVVAVARWRLGIPPWEEQRTCPCGEAFTAIHMRQRFCAYRCQRYHWRLVNVNGMDPEVADVALALWAYKRTLKQKGKGQQCGTRHAICSKRSTTRTSA